MAESLEERIDRLEKIALNAEKMARHARDVQEISNLMGRQVFMHEAGLDPTFADTIFARKTPGVTWEVANFGKFEGEEIRQSLGWHSRETYPIGSMFEHNLASPVIEVAGDGKTAKGVWMSPGHETMPDDKTGQHRAHWCWSKYGCDFVKEDGEWKFWHYHVYAVFRTPFEKSWVDPESTEREAETNAEVSKMLGKPGTTTYHHPYSTKTLPELVPEPPVPYETFDPAKAY
jgi:hypothetical protein